MRHRIVLALVLIKAPPIFIKPEEAHVTLQQIARTGLLGGAFVILTLPAFAQAPADQAERQPTPAQRAQQERMRTCNTDAHTRDLAGDARRTFMSDCLAGRSAPAAAAPSPAQAAQRERMTTCNAEATTQKLAAEARRSFMSDCLAGRAPASAAPARGR